MGAALFIVLEKEIENLDTFVNGKVLARAEPILAEITNELGVTPLIEFYGADIGDLAEEWLDNSDDFETLPESSAKWFEAKEGLKTVCALLDHLKDNPTKIKKSEKVIADLQDFKRVLEEADKQNVKWHLEVDF